MKKITSLPRPATRPRPSRSRTRSRAAVVARFPGSVFVESHGQPVVYVDRAVIADVARYPARRGAVHDARRHRGRRPSPRRLARAASPASSPSASRSSSTSCRTRATAASASSAEVPAADPTVPSLTPRVSRRELPRARVVRPLRHHVRRSSRSHAHPHARRLARPPAAQGRRRGAGPRDVQGRPEPTMIDRATDRMRRAERRGAHASSARPTRARRSCARRRARARSCSPAAACGREDDLGDTMIINMGPQHPSTHGVLRLMMELDGEDVLRIKPVIGYLHTGMEKTGEELTYVQGTTNVTRMDYASNFANELVYSMAVERLLDVEVPGTRGVDPHDDVRAVAHGVAPVVPGDERHGHRRGLDDALRLARARGGAAHLRVRHRVADELQLHPARRRRRRSARRLAAADPRRVRHRRARASPSTTSCCRRTRSGSSAPSVSA